jgi:polynucleotide 5'-hydroxyl-kinase GRC3/NOL9
MYDEDNRIFMTIIPEPAWEDLIAELLKLRGTAVVIGATDSGKSTLAHCLIRELVSESLKVCLVDSDVGQSSIGLPGTIGLKVFNENKGLKDFTSEKMSFVGTINPAKKIPFIIDTTKRMSDTCMKSSDITLIDTSGLVTGETGRALKVGKIKAIKPEHVIAVQRQDELEHILELIENLKIHRHRTSQHAKIRNIATRTHYRKKRFDDYFAEAGTVGFLLYTNEVKFLYNSRPFTPQEGMFKKGTLISLNHDADTIALGILDDITDTSVTFSSPVKSLKKINRVVFGDITV